MNPKDAHFMRLLGQEVAKVVARPEIRMGSWAHHEALDAAWAKAVKRSRGGL